MLSVHYTNLLVVVAAAFAANLTLGFFPRVRLPAIVLEILLGILIGPSAFGWVTPDLPVSILSLIGLSFLLFLAGLEIDVRRLRGRTLQLTAAGFALSFVIGIVLGLGLSAGGFVKSPLFIAIVLVSTSLGVIVPVLKDSDNIGSDFGQLVDSRGLDRRFRRDHPALPVLLGQGLKHHGHPHPARPLRDSRGAYRTGDCRRRAIQRALARSDPPPGHDR